MSDYQSARRKARIAGIRKKIEENNRKAAGPKSASFGRHGFLSIAGGAPKKKGK